MILASLIAAYLPMAALSVFLPVLAYLVARWRIHREAEPPDPQLGLKTVLLFFRVMAYQAMLVGAAVMVSGLAGSYPREAAVRAGAGILLPAALVHAAHRMALGRTNAGERPMLPRMFDGISLGLTGILAFTTMLMAGTALLGGGWASEGGSISAPAFVFGAAWVVQTLSFMRRVTAPPSAAAPPSK